MKVSHDHPRCPLYFHRTKADLVKNRQINLRDLEEKGSWIVTPGSLSNVIKYLKHHIKIHFKVHTVATLKTGQVISDDPDTLWSEADTLDDGSFFWDLVAWCWRSHFGDNKRAILITSPCFGERFSVVEGLVGRYLKAPVACNCPPHTLSLDCAYHNEEE